jgi:hypothetical protein
MKECSYCNEPLNEDEQIYFNRVVDEMPLCAQCILYNT